jgi:LmbE family N-acetylglucosaminyl deacetylase
MYEQTIPGGIVTSAFRHQLFVDISHTIDQKLAAVRAHRTQVENYDRYWVDGLKGRAMARGSIIGVQFAEAFEVVKEIGII